MPLSDSFDTDLTNMMADWGDTITIGANTYNGTYDPEYIEVEDFEGYAPVFTAKTADVLASSIARKTAVTVTSVIAGITAKAFTVGQMKDMHDGTTKLRLVE